MFGDEDPDPDFGEIFKQEDTIDPIDSNPLTGWHKKAKRCGTVGVKLGMTSDWDDQGKMYPLTIIHIADNVVVQVKTEEKEGYDALQVGAVNMKLKHTTKPLMGHFAKVDVLPKRKLVEFPVTKDCMLPVGTVLHAMHYMPTQRINVQGTSKGKGFQGGMKRWGFGGQPATHGVSLAHRSIGSTGQRQDPGKVFKGKKMPGRMGGERIFMYNSRVFKVDPYNNLIYVTGSVPGGKNSVLEITDSPKNTYYVETPPYPTYYPKEGEKLPLEVRFHYMDNQPDEWLQPDMTNPDRNIVIRAEKLRIAKEDLPKPQTLGGILSSIEDRKKESVVKRKREAEAKAQFLLATKKNAALQQQRKKEAAANEKKKEKD